jgi:uncharacterized membrane protein YhhN
MAEQSQTRRQPIKLGVLTIILTMLAVLTAAGAITAEIIAAEGLAYILKPVTIGLIIVIAIISYDPPKPIYKWAIVVGLILSLAGDILLMLPNDLFLWGLIAFALAQLAYTSAFINVGGFYNSWKAAIPFLLFGLFMAVVLWPEVEDMRLPVLVYLVIILVMAWQSYGHWRQTGETRSWLAFIGVLLFIASDSLLAINRFVYDLENLAPILILGTYYPAQWLIAQSAGRRHP